MELLEFIRDKKSTFTDKQLIKALYNTCKGKKFDIIMERVNLSNIIFKNLLSGKFEFKRGNTLASFAEAMNLKLEMTIKNGYDIQIPYDFQTGKQQMPKGSINRAY